MVTSATVESWDVAARLTLVVADDYARGRSFFEALTRSATQAEGGPPMIFYCQPEQWAESPQHLERWFNENVISTFAGGRTVVVFTTCDHYLQKFLQIALQTKVIAPTGVELVWISAEGPVKVDFDAEGNVDPNDLLPPGFRRWHLDLQYRFMGFEPLGDPE